MIIGLCIAIWLMVVGGYLAVEGVKLAKKYVEKTTTLSIEDTRFRQLLDKHFTDWAREKGLLRR